MSTPAYVSIINGAAALAKGLSDAGLKGPFVVVLNDADGSAFEAGVNGSIKIVEKDGAKFAETAGVVFQWGDLQIDCGTF